MREIKPKDIADAKHNAKRRKIIFSITLKYLNSLFKKQDGKCALSGLDLTFKDKDIEKTASIDRIDSSRGYVKGNVQWVHKHVNFMKHQLNQDRFIELCKLIAERSRKNE